MAITREKLVAFMNSNLGIDAANLDDDTPLFTSGLLDSFSLLDIVSFIETMMQQKLRMTEINLDNLDSIDRILAFVTSKAE